jgi:hypothetical protein
MGTKATVTGTTLTATHKANAQANGRNADAMNQNLADKLQDVIMHVSEMVKDMEAGANKTAYTAFLTTLG